MNPIIIYNWWRGPPCTTSQQEKSSNHLCPAKKIPGSLTFHESSWLVNRDPYKCIYNGSGWWIGILVYKCIMVYETIPISNWVVVHSLYTLNKQGPFFHCSPVLQDNSSPYTEADPFLKPWLWNIQVPMAIPLGRWENHTPWNWEFIN